MPANDSKKRLAKVAATTAVMLFVVWQVAPTVGIWHRGLLAKQLAQQVDAAEDSEVRIPLRQMAKLGEPAFVPLVSAAASRRAAVSAIARQILEEKIATWQQLAGTPSLEAKRLGDLVVSLADALAEQIDQFGPAGKQWVEHLALDMIDLADELPAEQTGDLLADCSRILVAIPPRGPKLRTIQAASLAQAPPPAAEAPQPKLETHSQASVIAWSKTPGDETNKALEIQARSSSFPPRDISTPVVKKPNWSPAWNEQQTQSIPAPKAKEGTAPRNTSERTIISNSSNNVVDVPTPLAMQNQAADMRELSTEELLQRLNRSKFYESGVIRYVLRERGFSRLELTLRQRLASSNVADRLRVLEEVSDLPATSARRVLRWLLDDPSAEVRLRALTAIATTNDPSLGKLARKLAVSDEDPQVSELAARILKRVR